MNWAWKLKEAVRHHVRSGEIWEWNCRVRLVKSSSGEIELNRWLRTNSIRIDFGTHFNKPFDRCLHCKYAKQSHYSHSILRSLKLLFDTRVHYDSIDSLSTYICISLWPSRFLFYNKIAIAPSRHTPITNSSNKLKKKYMYIVFAMVCLIVLYHVVYPSGKMESCLNHKCRWVNSNSSWLFLVFTHSLHFN